MSCEPIKCEGSAKKCRTRSVPPYYWSPGVMKESPMSVAIIGPHANPPVIIIAEMPAAFPPSRLSSLSILGIIYRTLPR
jgi:hypothetical protein